MTLFENRRNEVKMKSHWITGNPNPMIGILKRRTQIPAQKTEGRSPCDDKAKTSEAAAS